MPPSCQLGEQHKSFNPQKRKCMDVATFNERIMRAMS